MSVECDGPNKVDRMTFRKARLEHKCCACDETIRVGHRYVVTAAFYERWATWKQCLRCYELYDYLVDLHRDDDRYFPQPELDCGHDWRDVTGEDPPEHLAALAFWLPGEPIP